MRFLDTSSAALHDPLTVEDYRRFESEGWEGMIFRLHGGQSVDDYAARSLDAGLEYGWPVAGYVFLPADGAAGAVRESYDLIGESLWLAQSFVVVDVEGYQQPAENVWGAVRAIEDLGQRVVMYSSPGEWGRCLGDNTEFSGYPLWNAHLTAAAGTVGSEPETYWGRRSSGDPRPWKYGGWDQAWGRQYAHNVKVGDRTVDLNVGERALWKFPDKTARPIDVVDYNIWKQQAWLGQLRQVLNTPGLPYHPHITEALNTVEKYVDAPDAEAACEREYRKQRGL